MFFIGLFYICNVDAVFIKKKKLKDFAVALAKVSDDSAFRLAYNFGLKTLPQEQ